MALTNVPEALPRSVSRNCSLSLMIWQCRCETEPSSIHTEFAASRPIDRGLLNRNSDFPRGPLRTVSLGCTAKPAGRPLLLRSRHAAAGGRDLAPNPQQPY